MKNNNIEKSLKIVIVLTFVFFVVEVAGALASGSLSLLGDAGHMFRDVFALILSLGAIRIARKLPTKTKTFGFHRIEIFAAFVNGIMLLGICGFILYEAYHRFYTPVAIESTTMLAVAVVGLLVNSYAACRLHGSHDLNVRSAFLHVLTDLISSVAVIIAAVLIFFTDKTIIDPLLSIAIALFILYSASRIIGDSVRILLEFTPKSVDFSEVVGDIEKVRGVRGVHNVHLWSLCSNINVIDAHVFTEETDPVEIEKIKIEIKKNLQKFDIKHTTLEFEYEECADNEEIKELRH